MPWFNRKPKTTISRRKKSGLSAERLIFWLKRFGVSIAAVIFILWLGAWFFMSGASQATGDWARDKVLQASVDVGFGIENVLVEGRIHADRNLILSLLNVEKGDALFAVDLANAKDQIEKISWVKSATITRQLPDTLHINITERRPIALWQKEGKLAVIDPEGVVLTRDNLIPFKNFVIFSGKDAPSHAGDFLMLLSAEPALYNEVETAQFVSSRRWNITLKNGLLIQLPEEELSLAMAQLASHQKNDQLLERDIKAIDARTFPRIIVQTHPGEAYSYKADYQSEQSIKESAI